MKDLLNQIYDNLHWCDDQNEKVFQGHSHPIKYMETIINPEIMNKLKNLSTEHLITMIVNYRIMSDDLMNIVLDQLNDIEEQE